MSEPFIGEIKLGGWNFAPRSYAFCDGQLLAISKNSALFSLLGTNFGGDGRTTFGLPDLRGRVAIHAGHGPGLSDRRLGAKSGQEAVTLTTAEMPPHNHPTTLRAENRNGNLDDPTGAMLAKSAGNYRAQVAADDVSMDPAAIVAGNTGGGQSHNNMPPFQVVSYVIALQGIFPSRS